MVLLQHKLNVKLSQRQILTPGLVQMVSVLALNKLELKDMITAEMVENPVLEELEDAVPMLDDVGRQEEERDRIAAKATTEENPITATETKDPFEEIDFGSFFQEYLDPGYRSSGEMEEIEKPSFENFLSKPGNLTDHLLWQLGAISLRPPVHEAAEIIIGNLNEDGYLIASDEEILGIVPVAAPEADAETQAKIVGEAEALGIAAVVPDPSLIDPASDEPASIDSELSDPGSIDSVSIHAASPDLAAIASSSIDLPLESDAAPLDPISGNAHVSGSVLSHYRSPSPSMASLQQPPVESLGEGWTVEALQAEAAQRAAYASAQSAFRNAPSPP
ncbi:MAG: hypothetical protein WBQ00_14760, partial [Terriglobales bacterium]